MARTTKATEAAAIVHRQFKTAADLRKAVDAYFAQKDLDGTIATEQGLALHLGIQQATLRKWFDGESCEDLQETVRDAYAQMADRYQQLILRGEKNLVSFAIFMLKQPRFAGYADKQEVKTDNNVNINMGKNMDMSDWG